MPKRDTVGKALRRALGEEVVIPKIEPRKPGISYLINKRRLRIFEKVFNEPGTYLRKLHRNLDIPLQSLRWHVSVLVSAGIIGRVSFAKKEVLYSPMLVESKDVITMMYYNDEIYGPILRFISKQGEVSVKEIEKSLGIYQQLVFSRLKVLKNAGLVIFIGKRLRKRCKLSEDSSLKTLKRKIDKKSLKFKLLRLLKNQGLVPHVVRQTSQKLILSVDTGIEEIELTFKI